MSSQESRLPDFLVLGGMRCGSTTLYNALKNHPDLYLPEQKELHFFDGRNDELGKDLEAYKSLFTRAKKNQLCAEVTPDYLSCKNSFQNIQNTFDQLKCVVILREPIARAVSHYRLSIAAGFEVLSIDDAFQQEQERLKQRNEIADIYHSYLERSDYLAGLDRYASAFGQQNLHVMFLEELNRSPELALNQLCGFLNITPFSQEQAVTLTRPTNTSEGLLSAKRPQLSRLKKRILQTLSPLQSKAAVNIVQQELSVEAQRQLEDSFAVKNRLLSQWLGRELPW